MKITLALLLGICLVAFVNGKPKPKCEEEGNDDGEHSEHDEHDGHCHTLRQLGHSEDDGHDHSNDDLDSVIHDTDHLDSLDVECTLQRVAGGKKNNKQKILIQLVEPAEIPFTPQEFKLFPGTFTARTLHAHAYEPHMFKIMGTGPNAETWKNFTVTPIPEDHDFKFEFKLHGDNHYLFASGAKNKHVIRGKGKDKTNEFTLTTTEENGNEFTITVMHTTFGLFRVQCTVETTDHTGHDHAEEAEHSDHEGHDHGHEGHDH